ncbi:MAG TPA: tRNA (guanine-N7)-methyltransferase [Ilumatobacteraceae bacterium]|nr:tRNA (guanine-N7)-methyltransferase [Ilumatobacteraceae bacterium]
MRPTRTFQPRRRKLGPTRHADFERRLAAYGYAVDGPTIDARGAILDIGFGYGAALVELACADATAVIGVEVHTPGVAHVLEAIELHGLDHVRVVAGDLLEFLPRIPADSLSGVRIWFPDPWPKAKQRHRRMVAADVVQALVDRMAPGATLHLATDIADYATQMEAVCDAEVRLTGGVVARPAWRPVTAYETKGIAAGRTAVDLMYVKRATASAPGPTTRR